jgi:ectoine hydroxylase-related dioxygenase (phytanoyl-CoA dioxygenase family)
MNSATCAPEAPLLDQPFALDAAAIASYQRDGCVHLREVLDAATIAPFAPELTRLVTAGSQERPPLEQRDTYGKAFLQVGNLWEKSDLAKRVVFGKRLAQIAAELMGTRGVRMYHDQALDKEPGGGFTPWHADQQYWPLASPRCVTAWIPLQDIPLDMGPLEFALGSQHILEGRELQISDESEQRLSRTLADCPKLVEPFAVGDVSFHAGWCFHRAGPNRSQTYRRVMTIIYMDIDMRLNEPENPRQAGDRQHWCPGIATGEIINSPKNPVMWEQG